MRESDVAHLLATSVAALALLTGGPAGAGPAGQDGKAAKPIEGAYVLSRWGDPAGTPVTRMVITAREGNGFSVRGSDQAWSGEGRVDGDKGYYNWVFATGERGKTTFTINPDGTLKGEVSGEVTPWTFHARRAKAEGAERSVPAPGPSKLYTDEEIRKPAKHDIDEVTGRDEALLGTPYLDVVPAGESSPRAKVFNALDIDDARIQDFRHSQVDFVIFLYWQVSPSYDICCMSATNDRSNDGLALTDPRRKVYGVRLIKRVK
jgi:hypothetical protein